MKDNFLKIKSYKFAIRVVGMYKYLCQEKKEFIMSKQVLRSGTAVGALISEAEFAQSKADFINKMSVALKEANETLYWQNLLTDTRYLTEKMYVSMSYDCEEPIRMLVSSIKTAKKNKMKN